LIGFNAVPLEFTFLVGMAAVIAGMAASGVVRLIQPALQARMTGRWSLLPFYVYFASVTLMLLQHGFACCDPNGHNLPPGWQPVGVPFSFFLIHY